MNIALRLLSLMILVLVTSFYMGCKDKDEDKKTVEQTQLEKLKGVWVIQTATVDGNDRSSAFTMAPALTLDLSGTYAEGGTYQYSLTGSRQDPSPWPDEGKWKFGTNKSTEIIRDPNTDIETSMTYSVSDTDLIISFSLGDGAAGWPIGNGRANSVTGEWTFTFTKQ